MEIQKLIPPKSHKSDVIEQGKVIKGTIKLFLKKKCIVSITRNICTIKKLIYVMRQHILLY